MIYLITRRGIRLISKKMDTDAAVPIKRPKKDAEKQAPEADAAVQADIFLFCPANCFIFASPSLFLFFFY